MRDRAARAVSPAQAVNPARAVSPQGGWGVRVLLVQRHPEVGRHITNFLLVGQNQKIEFMSKEMESSKKEIKEKIVPALRDVNCT